MTSCVIPSRMAAAAASKCWLCTAVLTHRRTLGGPKNANSHALTTLNELGRKLFGSDAISSILPNQAVCRPCLRSVEKLIKVREDLSKIEHGVLLKMKYAGERCGFLVTRGERNDTGTSESEHSLVASSVGRQASPLYQTRTTGFHHELPQTPVRPRGVRRVRPCIHRELSCHSRTPVRPKEVRRVSLHMRNVMRTPVRRQKRTLSTRHSCVTEPLANDSPSVTVSIFNPLRMM